jgi:hypothetical protein
MSRKTNEKAPLAASATAIGAIGLVIGKALRMPIRQVARYVAGGTAAAATVAMLTVAPANAADKWVAIAYSPAEEVHAWSVFNDSQHDAESRAVLHCVGKGGTQCQVAGSTSNGCVALADTETHWAGGTGPSTSTAEHNAAAKLGGIATIVFSTCTG